MQENKELRISFQNDESFLVVQFAGNVCANQVNQLLSITQKVAELSKVKFVIFEMSRVFDIESRMIYSFAKIQKQIRDRRLCLRICGVNSSLRKRLFNRGVLREDEAYDNVTLAVKSLNRNDPGVAA